MSKVKVLPMAELLRLAREKEERERQTPSPADSTSHPDAVRRPESESHPVEASHVTEAPLAVPMESHPVSESLPDAEALPENLASHAYQLDYKKGNLRINFDYLDQVVGKLSRNARLFYIYLLRYRAGSTNYTVRLNWPTLEKKTDISRSVLHRAARELSAAGLAFSEGLELGKGKEQGFRFRLSHTASHTVDGSLPDSASHAVSADINRSTKIAKPNRDISRCPECEGRGFYYPQGFDKGVVICRHPNLK